MPVFYFPATLALMLRSRTWMSEIAVSSSISNYGRSGQEFWVKSRKPGSHHYHVRPAGSGFYVRSGLLSELTSRTPLTGR